MARPVVTIAPERTAREAARLMREHRFRHLPVAQRGRLLGLVSDRDVDARDQRAVTEVMRRQVITVSERTPVEAAATLMLENKIGCLPVLDAAGGLVGIVTESDLFRLLARLFGAQQPGTRLQLELDDLPRQVAIVAAMALRCGVPITTLVTAPPSASGPASRTVVLRVATINAASFVTELRRAGLRVDAPQWLAEQA